MAADTKRDRASFFNPADGADLAYINGQSVYGIFETPFSDADGIGSRESTFLTTETGLEVAEGDQVVVRDVLYLVAGQPEPDGGGMVVLRLERQT